MPFWSKYADAPTSVICGINFFKMLSMYMSAVYLPDLLTYLLFIYRSEIDSELLKDKTQVLGVLAADQQGLCLVSQGSIDSKLSNIAASLANVSKELDPEQMLPTIVLESNARYILTTMYKQVIK